jgi:Mrp family chromosome partitioning ATPase
MSKLRQTLRQSSAGPVHSEPDVPVIEADEMQTLEEIPYIEVGPRRSLEGSPAVLASISAAKTAPTFAPGPAQTPPPAPASQPSPLPKPHNVLFRSLTPPSRFAPELVAFHAPGSLAGTRYAELLESLLGAVVDKGGAAPTAMLLIGTRSEAGTTTVGLNVAITAARQGLRVAVVDANLRRPAVAARLGLEASPGLTEVLAEERTIAEALRTTEQTDLTVLTAGSPAPTLATTEAIGALLAELRERFDLVLVDGPRWEGRGAVAALAGGCDAVFVVVPRGEADSTPARDLVRSLPEQGIRLAGCILTGD